MTDTPTISRPTHPALLIGLPVIAVLIAAAALYFALVQAPTQAGLAEQQALLLRLTGVTQAVTNRLDPEYKDADGDLIADVPTDPAKLLDPEVIRVSYIANDEPEEFEKAFKEFCDHLAKSTGKKVEYVLLRSATDELRGLKDGTLHVAGFNTGNVPRAVNLAGFVPVASVAAADGNVFIRSLIIAPTGSSVRALADLKGRELTLTDAGSNSGYRVPLSLAKSIGLLPVRDYGLRYSGSHNQSIARVAAGNADAAAVASDILARETAAGTIRTEQYVVVAVSSKFPAGTIGLAHNLKPELAGKLRQAITNFEWKGTGLETVLGSGGSVKFQPINYKDDFALVRKIDDDTGNVHKLDP